MVFTTFKPTTKDTVVVSKVEHCHKEINFELGTSTNPDAGEILIVIHFDTFTNSAEDMMREIKIGDVVDSVEDSGQEDFWLGVAEAIDSELHRQFPAVSQGERNKVAKLMFNIVENEVEKENIATI